MIIEAFSNNLLLQLKNFENFESLVRSLEQGAQNIPLFQNEEPPLGIQDFVITREIKELASITLHVGGIPKVGALLNTENKDFFHGVLDKGCQSHNGQFLFEQNTKKSVVYTAHESSEFIVKGVPLLEKAGFTLIPKPNSLEAVFALCVGEADVYVAYDAHPYDVGAGAIVVQEGGGIILPITGNEIIWNREKTPCLMGVQNELTEEIRESIKQNLKK